MNGPRNVERNDRLTRVVGGVLGAFVLIGVVAALSNNNSSTASSTSSGSGASGVSGAALAQDVSMTSCFIGSDGAGGLMPEATGMIVNHQSSMQSFYISVDFFQAGIRIDNGVDDESDVPAGGQSPWSAQGMNFNVNENEKLTCKIVQVNNF